MRYFSGLIIFIALFSLSNCEKEAKVLQKDYPFVETIAPIVNEKGVVFSADIVSLGNQKILKYGFVWSEDDKPTILNSHKLFNNNSKKGIYTYNLNSGLVKGESYNVRAYILTEDYEVYGSIKSFISLGCLPPKITNFFPDSASGGHIITIIGENFGIKPKSNIVKFGNKNAIVIESCSDTLKVYSPQVLSTRKELITIEVAGTQTISDKIFKMIYPWKKLDNFPGGHRFGSFSFVIGNKGYTASGKSSQSTSASLELWEYDSEKDEWMIKSDFPGTPRYNATAFSINGKGYVCFGIDENYDSQNDLWEYNPVRDVWNRKSDYSDELGVCQSVLILDDKVVLVNNDEEAWSYDPYSDVWERIKENVKIGKVKLAHNYDGNGYFLNEGGGIWMYFFDRNVFQYIIQLPVTNMWGAVLIKSFQLKDNLYFATNPYWIKYDIQSKKTFDFYNWPFNTGNGIDILFSFEDKVYMSNSENAEFWEYYPR